MATWIEAHEETGRHLAAGERAKGEYRCLACGYGVTVHRELPRCPMCGAEAWEALAWMPFTRAGVREEWAGVREE